jgi:predicted membrane chloride channel (bestrophin family)
MNCTYNITSRLQIWPVVFCATAQVASPHPPNFCILVLSHTVANCGLDQFAVTRLQSHLANLSQSLSACDRILNTPIPLSYTR